VNVIDTVINVFRALLQECVYWDHRDEVGALPEYIACGGFDVLCIIGICKALLMLIVHLFANILLGHLALNWGNQVFLPTPSAHRR